MNADPPDEPVPVLPTRMLDPPHHAAAFWFTPEEAAAGSDGTPVVAITVPRAAAATGNQRRAVKLSCGANMRLAHRTCSQNEPST